MAQTRQQFDDDLVALQRRLARMAISATEMLESALRALRALDVPAAKSVRKDDKKIDFEEVAIESECLRLMTLQQPFGSDFRQLTFCLKVNQDIERVADHAASIAKIAMRLAGYPSCQPWPTAMGDMGERVPVMCHQLLRAVIDRDADAARRVMSSDKTIDKLEKQLFTEIVERMERTPEMAACGMLINRVGRELERVGDLMCNIAEDVIYLVTGEIVRHEKSRHKAG